MSPSALTDGLIPEVAKDSNASAGTRMEAAKDAAGNKVDETKHSVRINEKQCDVCHTNLRHSDIIVDCQPRTIDTGPQKAHACC